MDRVAWIPNFSLNADSPVHAEIQQLLYEENSLRGWADVNCAMHRCVYTVIAGSETIFDFAHKTCEIVLSSETLKDYNSEHPFIGLIDVCPFTVEDKSQESNLNKAVTEFSEKLAKDFNLPIFLYALSDTLNRRPAYFRKGGLLSLSKRMASRECLPDFGPNCLHPDRGACIVGLRPPLIAVNFNCKDVAMNQVASWANELRESSHSNNSIAGLQAIAWHANHANTVQLSCNIIDCERLSLKRLFDRVTDFADEHGKSITGTELIGCIPRPLYRKDFPAKFSDSDIGEYLRLWPNLTLEPSRIYDWKFT